MDLLWRFLKRRLILKRSLADLELQFSKIVNFRPRKPCVVSNCSVRQARTFNEIEIVITSKTTKLTHGKQMSPKTDSIIIFMLRSLCRDKL